MIFNPDEKLLSRLSLLKLTIYNNYKAGFIDLESLFV